MDRVQKPLQDFTMNFKEIATDVVSLQEELVTLYVILSQATIENAKTKYWSAQRNRWRKRTPEELAKYAAVLSSEKKIMHVLNNVFDRCHTFFTTERFEH